MTRSIDTESKRRLPATPVAGIAISAFLLLGTFVAPASANGGQNDHHWNNNNYNRGNGSWGGSYYVYDAPYDGPQYYGSPVYVPPPVIYAPGIGINLPGLSIGIQ